MATKKASKEDFDTLDEVIEEVNKRFGEGSIRQGDMLVDCEVIPTSAIPLDIALGVGGVPRARITEIYGPEGSGKTTLALHLVANVQKNGGIAAYIDAEHALDPTYMKNIGIDMDALVLSQPDCGENALETAELLCKSGKIDVVVVDSVASLIPKAELEGNIGDHHVGAQARMMSQALRKIVGAVRKSSTALVFINQLREKIGVMFGNPETTPGGRALKFYASVRIDIRRISVNKDSGEALGNRVRCKIVKNKVAPPLKIAEFDIVYGTGISRAGCLLDLAVEQKVVSKRGSNHYFGEEKIANSRPNSVTALEENEELLEKIEKLVLEKLGLSVENTVDDSSEIQQG